MAKFIEVHYDGEPRLVNLDYVEKILACYYGCSIHFSSVPEDFRITDESYEQLRMLIAKAQGGIPMNHERKE